jgi:hypothetical protein
MIKIIIDILISMSRTFNNAEELYEYLLSNPSYKNQILATIPLELKKQYKNYQAKLRQQRYRKANRDVANERSRIKMASNRSTYQDKYKQMNSHHNKTYRNKIKMISEQEKH